MLRMVSARKSPLRSDGPQPRLRAEHRARHQQVVLAVRGALRVPGRAAGVRDARGRERVDVGSRTGRRVRPRARRATPPARPRRTTHAARRRSPDAAPRSAASHSSSDVPLSSRRNCFSGGAERAVDPHPHRAEAHRAVEGEDDVEVVGQRARDPVAGAHAEGGERVRGTGGEPVELGVRPPTRAGDQRLAVGIGRDDRTRRRPRSCAAGDGRGPLTRGRRAGVAARPSSAGGSRCTRW